MEETAKETKTRTRGWRRVRRIAARAGIALLALVLVVVLALAIPGVRGWALREALLRADAALPGALAVESASWPGPGTIELRGLNWTEDGDTLVRAQRLRVEVRLWPLVHRDVDVEAVELTGAAADIPGITALFPAAPDTTSPAKASEPPAFPRAGAFAGLPSVAVRRLEVSADSVRLSESDIISGIQIEAGANLLHGEDPTARIDRLAVTGTAKAWGIERMDIAADLASGVVDGTVAGHATPRWPFYVTLASGGPDRLVITAALREDAAPPRDPGARIVLDLERSGIDLESARVRADIRTPGVERLAEDPSLAPALEGLQPLEGILARIDATVDMAPALSADATVRIEKNAWLDSLRVEAGYRDGAADVKTLALALDGLALTAKGRAGPDSLRADVDIDVTGGGWLEAILSGTQAPENLEGYASLQARGEMPPEHLRAALTAGTMGYHAGLRADVDLTVGVTARLSPLLLRASRIRTAPAIPERAGTVRLDTTGAVRADAVRIEGDFGTARLDAALDSAGTGRVRLAARWRDFPRGLAGVLGLEPAAADSMRALWAAHGPFAVDAQADLTGAYVDAQATLDLPGPRTLAPLLPAGADVSDLGNLRGVAAARITTGDSTSVTARVDLGATAWIDTLSARVRTRGNAVSVDTMTVAIASIHARASGELADSLGFDANVDIDDETFLRRFAPDIPSFALAFEAAARGTKAEPEVDADLAATVDDIHVTGTARVDPRHSFVRIEAPDGVTVPQARFDIAELTVRTHNPGAQFLPADVTVKLSGEGLSLYHASTVSDTAGIVIAADTLGFVIGGHDLETRRPFSVRVGPDSGTVVLDGLRMEGELGSLQADATLSPDSAVADVDLAVKMPAKPVALALPDDYWPGALNATVRARPDGELRAEVGVAGITLADGTRPDVQATVEASTADMVTADIEVTGDGRVILEGHGRFPAELSLAPLAFHTLDGDADVSLRARGVPVPSAQGDRIMRVGADVDLSGTVAAPAGSLSVTLEFPGWPKLEGYLARLHGAVRAGSGNDALEAHLELLRSESELLGADVNYRGPISMTPPVIPMNDGGQIEIHARSQKLSLSEFDALLPPDIALGGAFALKLDAQGPPSNPEIDGRVELSGTEVNVKQRLRLVSNGTLTLEGTLEEPAARGKLTIESGVIRIPDPPPDLLPTSGQARLLEGQRMQADEGFMGPPAPAEPIRGDIDINVDIPGGLWVRGQGLEMELAGSLRIQKKGGRPMLTGELRAQRGSLTLLGRNFTLDRGSVVFYGDDEIDPSLDVQLSTHVNDATIRVIIGGTAGEPKFSLESDPEMEEGDIMSYLVFGRRLDGLDENQKNLVQTRAAEIAVAMGAAQLQDALREQLGVDLVTIRAASSDSEASALVVGKYLNPDLLLKYEQLLEEQSAQFINLEYFITRHFKLEALYGRQDQQGVEVEWSNDY